MTEADIASLLEQAARRPGLLVGRRLGHGNEFTIPDMARRAAIQILLKPEGPERDATIRRGEAAFALLGEEMVRAAQRLPGYPPDQIGEQTLGEAIRVLGAFPPFW